MKILALADTHLRAASDHRRDHVADQERTLDAITDLAIDRDVALCLHGGDVFHRTKPTPAELHSFRRFARRLAQAEIPMVAVLGNGSHEAATDDRSALELFDSRWLRVSRRPEYITEFAGVTVCTLPAVPLARLSAAVDSADRGEVNGLAVDALMRIAAELREAAPDDRPCALVGHWAVSGGSLPTGLPVDALHEPVLPLAGIKQLGYDAALFGHVHVAALLDDSPQSVISLGSPMTMDFGEADVEHGCWIIETHDEARSLAGEVIRYTSAEFVPLPDRRFITVDADLTEMERECPNCNGKGWISRAVHAHGCDGESCSQYGCPVEEPEQCGQCWGVGHGTGGDESDQIAAAIAERFPLTDAVLRIRYKATDEQHRRVDQGALKRLAMDAGAHLVYQIEPEIVRAQRSRVEGFDRGLSAHDALGAWCDANGVNGDQAAGLYALLTHSRQASADALSSAAGAFDPVRLDATNVGRFTELHVDFRDGATVLLGENGSGKTTILRCLELALYAEDAGDLKALLAPWADALTLQLEFLLDEVPHRVRRGYRRGGRATVDFERLAA